MTFISTPLTINEVFYGDADNPMSKLAIHRDFGESEDMLDNLVELVIFTPKGSFAADPDFGFEYWNHEYVNVPHDPFNNGHIQYLTSYTDAKGVERQKTTRFVTKSECQESIRRSLKIYAPQLEDVNIEIHLDNVGDEDQTKRKLHSRTMVKIIVDGVIREALLSRKDYHKEVTFLIEPTVKKYKP